MPVALGKIQNPQSKIENERSLYGYTGEHVNARGLREGLSARVD